MWHLDNFSNEQLKDIVENYESYKYDETVKFQAEAILKKRGIQKDKVALEPSEPISGFNKKYIHQFKKLSINTIVLYILLLVFQTKVDSYEMLYVWGGLFLTYLIFMIFSFRAYKKSFSNNTQHKPMSGFKFFLFGFGFYPILSIILIRQLKKISTS